LLPASYPGRVGRKKKEKGRKEEEEKEERAVAILIFTPGFIA
jgi:hypothetical protein